MCAGAEYLFNFITSLNFLNEISIVFEKIMFVIYILHFSKTCFYIIDYFYNPLPLPRTRLWYGIEGAPACHTSMFALLCYLRRSIARCLSIYLGLFRFMSISKCPYLSIYIYFYSCLSLGVWLCWYIRLVVAINPPHRTKKGTFM